MSISIFFQNFTQVLTEYVILNVVKYSGFLDPIPKPVWRLLHSNNQLLNTSRVFEDSTQF